MLRQIFRRISEKNSIEEQKKLENELAAIEMHV